MTADLQQIQWDREDATARLRHLHALHQRLAAAETRRALARTEYALAIHEEKEARAALLAAVGGDARPMPLFDPPREREPQEEPATPPEPWEMPWRERPLDRIPSIDPITAAKLDKEGIHTLGHLAAAQEGGTLPRLRAPILAALHRIVTEARNGDDGSGTATQEEVEACRERVTAPEPPEPTIPEGEPWPEWMTPEVAVAAYIVPALSKGKDGKPVTAHPFEWDGRLWVVTGMGLTDTATTLDVLPLISLADWEHTCPGLASRYRPGSDTPSEWYTGVILKVGKKQYAIAPAGEKRVLVERKEQANG